MEKRVEQEAFVYLWYDAPNKKYYLGKHKGTPDDGYTHSSRSSDEFCSIVPDSGRPISERLEFFENMPKGVSRRILAYGTDEEMCILEHELLANRKKRCWDRYYNESLGDPRYVDISGENHPNWKGGIKVNDPVAYMKEYRLRNKEKFKALRKEYMKEYRLRNKEKIKAYEQTPKRKEYMKAYKKEYEQTPKRKEYMKEYRLRNKEKFKALRKEYEQTPKRKEYKKEYMKEYRLRKKAEIRANQKEYYLRKKAEIRANQKEYYLRKKAERQGESTLDRFME